MVAPLVEQTTIDTEGPGSNTGRPFINFLSNVPPEKFEDAKSRVKFRVQA